MKTIELKIFSLITFGTYFSYVYYLITSDDAVLPSNFFYGLGSFIDAFFFNHGVKPKKAIKDAPNHIAAMLNPPPTNP
jgi:hypothetical protein